MLAWLSCSHYTLPIQLGLRSLLQSVFGEADGNNQVKHILFRFDQLIKKNDKYFCWYLGRIWVTVTLIYTKLCSILHYISPNVLVMLLFTSACPFNWLFVLLCHPNLYPADVQLKQRPAASQMSPWTCTSSCYFNSKLYTLFYLVSFEDTALIGRISDIVRSGRGSDFVA